MKASCAFSNALIEKELKTASNIKDRVNRQCVQRCLKIIDGILFKIKVIPPTGLFLFVGIDKNDNEIVEIVEPPVANKLAYYRCDNKFHTWIVEDIFKPKLCATNQILVLITGDEARFYRVGKTVSYIGSTQGLLIKRHRKGGQSSIRFARLAEESRHHYTEKIITDLKSKGIDTTAMIIVSGSRELGKDLVALLNKRSWKDASYTEEWINFNNDTTRRNEAEIISFFDNIERKEKEAEINEFMNNIHDVKGDVIGYYTDLIVEERPVERIICNEDVKKIDWWPENKVYIVRMDSPLYVKLKKFGGVVCKFFIQ